MTDINRTITHPGEILFKKFIQPSNLSIGDLANDIDCTKYELINLITKACSLDEEMAEKLSAYFQNSAGFWMNLQNNYSKSFTATENENDAVVEVCNHEMFEFRCNQKWQNLTETDDENIRICNLCSENVYLCLSQEEVAQKSKEKKCVAYSDYDMSAPSLGVPDGGYEP